MAIRQNKKPASMDEKLVFCFLSAVIVEKTDKYFKGNGL